MDPESSLPIMVLSDHNPIAAAANKPVHTPHGSQYLQTGGKQRPQDVSQIFLSLLNVLLLKTFDQKCLNQHADGLRDKWNIRQDLNYVTQSIQKSSKQSKLTLLTT
eukprot:TRINITY_DN10266_c1_g2_i1.p4 TRINITY_DN10266_c1_g2~~TRINITY_DN10266_c1_g2_i1.p4  ORF type:complete len:106 (-),score=0.20 TRINITY_DN10266_c1_g2_i1:104-421(-)